MDFKEDVNCNDGLLKNFFEYIKSEILNGLTDYPELKKFINDNHISLLLKTYSIADLINDDLRIHKGHITKGYTKRLLRDWADKESNSTVSVFSEWAYKNGKVYIIHFIVRITAAALAKDICDNIYDLELYKKKLRWLIKHEIGHMLDYMINRHDISVEELQRLLDRDRKDYEQYYEELSKINEWTYDVINEDNRKYYRIHQEAAANAATGIDVEEMIELDNEIRNKYHNKVVTLQISQSDIHDIPMEVKNET